MASRVLVGIAALVAVVNGFAGDVIPMGGLILVAAGIVYGAMAVDAEDATGVLVVAVAASGAAASGALDAIPAIGMQLNGILGGLSTALWGVTAAVVGVRTFNRVKG